MKSPIRTREDKNVEVVEKEVGSMWACCPVNRRTPIRISKDSFIRMCLAFQGKAKIKTNTFTTSLSSWDNRCYRICINCHIGEKVRNNKRFSPPKKVQLVEWSKKKMALKRRRRKVWQE